MTGSGLNYSKLTAVIVVFMLAAFSGWFLMERQASKRTVKVGGHSFQVDLADDMNERTRGLSGRQLLGPMNGMLFVFDDDANTCIWMKDMHFPIDIVWFDASGVLVDTATDVSPQTFPNSFCSDKPAKYVLEIPAGTVEKLELPLGAKLEQ